jgi:hypothetical protein
MSQLVDSYCEYYSNRFKADGSVVVGPIGPCVPPNACGGLASDCQARLIDQIRVIHNLNGTVTVSWMLGPNQWNYPLEFSLQASSDGGFQSDDAETVVDFQAADNYLIDPKRRNVGWYEKASYRIAVRDAVGGLLYSVRVPANQVNLNTQQRRIYQEIHRREHKRYRMKATPSTLGILLKVKYYGDRCTTCTGADSGEPTRSHCPECFGIGYTQGYQTPIPCFNADLSITAHDLKMFDEQGPFINGGIGTIRFLNSPQVHPWDIWVDAQSDRRYVIGQIQPLVSFGSVDLVCRAAVARLALDHPAHSIDLSDYAIFG